MAALNIETQNPFSVLSVEDTNKEEEINEEKINKPPPIYVKNVANFNILCTALCNIINKENFSCQTNVRQVIINTKTPEAYRKTVDYLRQNKASFHTYQLPEDKPYRVVIRGLHHTTPTDEVHKELEDLGFQVKTVTNVHHPVTKSPLPLFFVDLKREGGVDMIFKLRTLYYSKIKVEEPYKRLEIPQCQHCQEWGHTKSYCGHPARCVRCGGNHESVSCKKTRDTPATCALCGGAHPANYKGCTVFQDLQKLKRPVQSRRPAAASAQEAAVPSTARVQPTPQPPQPAPRQRLQTIPSRQHGPPTMPQQGSSFHHNSQGSYAQAISGKRHAQANHSPPPQPSNPTLPDLSSQLSSFLGQFTSVANQLILAISSLVTILQGNMRP